MVSVWAASVRSRAEDRPPRILISGGGTSGHIHPALAIAEGIRSALPAAEILYCGTETGLESSLVPAAGFPFQPISAGPFPHRLGPGFDRAIRLFFQGKREAAELLRQRRPDLVIGTGGYVCGPLLAAAHAQGIPVLIHEQNAYPGRSNRFAARKGATVCLGYGVAARYFKRASRVVETGNPIRPEFFALAGKKGREEARQKLGLTASPIVLISGGSLGARQLNQVAIEWARQQQGFPGRVILASGSRLYEETQALAASLPKSAPLEVKPYLQDMPLYLAAADLVIGRAGASTCAELAALGKATVFIPYPYAAGDHQTRNAQVFSESGAGLCIPEKLWSPEQMSRILDSLLREPTVWANRGEAAARLARPEAIASILAECAARVGDSWLQWEERTDNLSESESKGLNQNEGGRDEKT